MCVYVYLKGNIEECLHYGGIDKINYIKPKLNYHKLHKHCIDYCKMKYGCVPEGATDKHVKIKYRVGKDTFNAYIWQSTHISIHK